MSTAHAAAFDAAIKDGLVNATEIAYHLSGTASDTKGGFTDSLTTVGSNPSSQSSGISTVWSRSGSVITLPSQTFESNSKGQTANQFKIRVDHGVGREDYGTWNGGTGFNESFDNGKQITLSGPDVDCQRSGIAEALREGVNNLNGDVFLLDDTGSRIADTWAQKTGTGDPSQSLNASSSNVGYGNDMTFSNNSGSSQLVGGIEVAWNFDQTLLVIADTFTAVTVEDGGSITFTTLRVDFDSLD